VRHRPATWRRRQDEEESKKSPGNVGKGARAKHSVKSAEDCPHKKAEALGVSADSRKMRAESRGAATPGSSRTRFSTQTPVWLAAGLRRCVKPRCSRRVNDHLPVRTSHDGRGLSGCRLTETERLLWMHWCFLGRNEDFWDSGSCIRLK
jgi:hypothetical protein